ncbi:MAG: HD domain-containing protein [Aquificota bacterium]|nr:HD domain-containing protein [Aquificota bacterium]
MKQRENLLTEVVKEFSDPLYGFVRVSSGELKLIDTLIFQRLRHIKQLGTAYLVFPSAQHSRFEHAIGVLHLTDLLLSRTRAGSDRRIRDMVRVAGLLHDLGHPPFSHTTEVLIPDERGHEELTGRIILETEIYDILRKDLKFSHEEVESVVRITTGNPDGEEEKFLSSLITGQFGSDRMDYLRRDAFFCGVSYGIFDYQRLLSTVEEVEGKLVVHISGLRALENFLIGRYFMYVQVYFHKVVRILNLHLIDLIGRVLSEKHFTDLGLFLRTNDTTVLAEAFSNPDLRDLTERVFGRKHFKEVFSTRSREEFEEAKDLILSRIPPDKVKFDSVYKEPFDEDIEILDGDRLVKATEVSDLIGSLKPIEIHRIYVDADVREEAWSLLRG